MIYIRFGNVCVEVLAFDEAQEKFVNHLDVRPCYFQNWLVLLRIESLTLRIHWRRDWPEQVLGKHLDYAWVHFLGDDLAVVGNVV